MDYTYEEIEKFILNAGSDSTRWFGGGFDGGIHCQQMPDELANCIYLILNSNKEVNNYMEIGTASGGTLYILNYFFNFDKIAFIDDNRHKKAVYRDEILKDIQYKSLIGDSKDEEIKKKVKSLKIKFDMIMIDGDHSYEGVKSDFDMYSEFLAKDGYLLFHDSFHPSCPGIKQFVSELKENKEYKFIQEFVSKLHNTPCGLSLFQKQEVIKEKAIERNLYSNSDM